MLIEAYGAPGAIALSDRYSVDFLKSLISQTVEMRKTDEDREAELFEDKQTEFLTKNKHRSVNLTKQNGEVEKISLSQFAITNEQLLGVH